MKATSLSELISMMNRKLAQGRHVEWVRTSSECVRASGRELVRAEQGPALSDLFGTREGTLRGPRTPLAEPTYDGLWPHIA